MAREYYYQLTAGESHLKRVPLRGTGSTGITADDLDKAESFAKEALKLDPEGLAPRFFAIDIFIAGEKYMP